jgi:hypothetical protein
VLPKFIRFYPELGDRVKALVDYEVPTPSTPVEQQPTKKAQQESSTKKGPGTPDTSLGALNVAWQTLGVGFGSGALAALLLTWQLREIARRRQARAAQAGFAEATNNAQPENR